MCLERKDGGTLSIWGILDPSDQAQPEPVPSRAFLLVSVPCLALGPRPHGGCLLSATSSGVSGRGLRGPACLGVSPGTLRPELVSGDEAVAEVAESRTPGSHYLDFPGRGPGGRGHTLPGAWALANHQQPRLLGGFYFKQKEL